MLKKSDTWCPEIFRGLFIDRINDDHIRVAPCCQACTSTESIKTFDFSTNSYLQRLRSDISQGHKPNACSACWNVESVGHKSRRQSAIEFYQVEYDDQSVVLEGLDYSATWACNLACIMCGPNNSSTWANELSMTKDDLINIGKLFQKKNNFTDNLDISRIKKIHFNGGEPLLNDDQTILLKRLSIEGRLGDVFISYNTNASVMPSDKVIDLWDKARLVKLFFSIDATSEAFRYIRWPANWDTIRSNILKMKKNLPNNVMFGFNTTVGLYNIFEVRDAKDWFDQNLACNREGDLSDFNWQLAENFNPKWLKKNVKELAIDYVGESVDSLATYLRSVIDHPVSNHWIEKLNQIDKRRGLNWRQHLKIGNYYS